MSHNPSQLSSEQIEYFKKVAYRCLAIVGVIIGISVSVLLRLGWHIAPEVALVLLISMAIFFPVVGIFAFGPRHNTLAWLAGRFAASLLLTIPFILLETLKIGSTEGLVAGYLASIPFVFVLMIFFIPRNPLNDPFSALTRLDKWVGWRN